MNNSHQNMNKSQPQSLLPAKTLASSLLHQYLPDLGLDDDNMPNLILALLLRK